MGMGQRVNPHTIRVSNLYMIIKIHTFNEELFNRSVALENLLGEAKYRRIISKVRKISR